jgi:hypothetical protein
VITDQRAFLEDLMAAVEQAMDSGIHSPDVLRDHVKLPKEKDWRNYDEWLPMNLGRILPYGMVSGPTAIGGGKVKNHKGA